MEPLKITITVEWDPETGLHISGRKHRQNGTSEVSYFEPVDYVRSFQKPKYALAAGATHVLLDLIDAQ